MTVCMSAYSQEETLALPQGGGAQVADHATREAAQDRRTHGPPRPLHHLPVGRGGRLAAGVRTNPGADRPAACAAGADLIEVITARGKATGEVCLDDRKTGVQCDETAAGVDPGGWRSVWSQPVSFTIAPEAGDTYAEAQNRRSSEQCRLRRFRRRSKPCFLRHRCIFEGRSSLNPRSPPLRDRGEDYG